MESQNRALLQGKMGRKGKGGFQIIFIVILVLIAAGTGYYYFSSSQKTANKVPTSVAVGGRSGQSVVKKSTTASVSAKVEPPGSSNTAGFDSKNEALKRFPSFNPNSGEVKLYFRNPTKGDFQQIGFISRQDVENSTLLVSEEELKKSDNTTVKMVVAGWRTKEAIWHSGANPLSIVSTSSLYFIDR